MSTDVERTRNLLFHLNGIGFTFVSIIGPILIVLLVTYDDSRRIPFLANYYENVIYFILVPFLIACVVCFFSLLWVVFGVGHPNIPIYLTFSLIAILFLYALIGVVVIVWL